MDGVPPCREPVSVAGVSRSSSGRAASSLVASASFTVSMGEGHHRFSYTVRAKTPGTFLAAPAKAEEMYSPETFGRSTGETVVIE
jgi:hypothetical protein